MSKELAKTYDPKGIEERLYQKWMDNGYFHAKVNPDKKPFTIVMPPPNVTGQLHMGHALDETMQDILIRFKRMQGYEALWQPGTDHAAIATEVKVTEKLKKEGIDKAEIGREKFLEYAWEWKEEYGGKIINQLKKLGASADWERERFTMDEGCSKAVQEVFIKLYEKGYIYKGSRIINWCPVCQTSISDAEVEHEDQDGFFWHINYPVVGEEGKFVEIATTRPKPPRTSLSRHPRTLSRWARRKSPTRSRSRSRTVRVRRHGPSSLREGLVAICGARRTSWRGTLKYSVPRFLG